MGLHMKFPERTKLFVFCVAIAIEILVAVMWYRRVPGIYYLPFFTPFFSGALLCSLLRSDFVKSTVLLGIMISVVGGGMDWVTWRLGIQQEVPVFGGHSLAWFSVCLSSSLYAAWEATLR